MELALRAREAASVRIPSGASHAVAPHAELLAGAAVAASARGWIDPRLLTVLTASKTRGHPIRRMGTAAGRAWGDQRLRVASGAGALAVARRAEARVRSRLECV